jgi:rhomboid protease GluP
MSLVLDRPRVMRGGVGGQVSRLLEDGEWWRLATSCLLHADVVHLTLNALGLVALGRFVEPMLGPWRMLSWFVLGGLGGSLASWLVGVRYSDGASGGAFALLGAIAVIGWVERETTLELDRRLFGPILWAFVAGNVALSFLVPMIDVAGHLGGLAVGLFLGLYPGRSRGLPAWVDQGLVVAFTVVCIVGWVTLFTG